MSTTCPIKDIVALNTFKNYYLEQRNYRNYALIIVGLNTALRIGDILMLQWKDVYLFDKRSFRQHISLTEQKTGKQSIIAMNEAVQAALSLLLQESGHRHIYPDSFLFASQKNREQPISRYQAYRIIRSTALHAGMEENISCHSLRKTFGYFAWKQGVPPAMLMNIYNHSSYQITKKYLCIEQDDRDQVFMNIQL